MISYLFNIYLVTYGISQNILEVKHGILVVHPLQKQIDVILYEVGKLVTGLDVSHAEISSGVRFFSISF